MSLTKEVKHTTIIPDSKRKVTKIKRKKVLEKLPSKENETPILASKPHGGNNVALWLGLNSTDAAANLAFIPFILGTYLPIDLSITIFLYILTLTGFAFTIFLYFTHRDHRFSEEHWNINKWLTIIFTVMLVISMGFIVSTKIQEKEPASSWFPQTIDTK